VFAGRCVSALLLGVATLSACTSVPEARGRESSLQRYALMQTLNAELLASRSATATLREWCAQHRLAQVAEIIAEQVSGAPVPPSTEQRARLGVSAGEPIKYRVVRLSCGGKQLSLAENWYVPSRLTPEMNNLLVSTQTPFGQVIAALQPYRHTFDMQVHWPLSTRTLPDGEMPQALFEHRAVVYSQNHEPLAEVHEIYQAGALP
jgi:chorismate-pyruvate lyase